MYYLAENSPPKLPAELILEIGWHCDQPTLNALVRTSRAAARYLTSMLYDRRIFAHKDPQRELPHPEYPPTAGFVQRVLDCARIWRSEHVLRYLLRTFKYDSPCLLITLPTTPIFPRYTSRYTCKGAVYPFLHTMARTGNLVVVKALIEAGAPVDHLSNRALRTPLHCACKGGHEDVVKYLLHVRASVEKRDAFRMSTLCFAAHAASPSLLSTLVRAMRHAGVNPFRVTKKWMMPMHFAAGAGNAEAVRLLVECGADPAAVNMEGRTPFAVALEHPRGTEAAAIALIQGMVMRRQNISCKMLNGRTPLHYAAHRGYEQLVRCLLESDADVSAVDDEGRTALHDALITLCRSPVIVRLLLSHGADPTVRDSEGIIPFSYVTDEQDRESDYAGILLEAPLERREMDPVHARLWRAARHGRIPPNQFNLLARLLSATSPLKNLGAIHTVTGPTALHLIAGSYIDSCNGKSVEMAKILIDAGAEIATKDYYGYTPFHYAVREFCRQDSHMAPFMLKYPGIHGTTHEENEAIRQIVDRDLSLFLQADKDGDPLTKNKDGNTRVDVIVDMIQDEELARRARRLLGREDLGQGRDALSFSSQAAGG